MKCPVLEMDIDDLECRMAVMEAYKEKNGRELPKRFKRIIGWKAICKNCQYHQEPGNRK